MYETDSWDLAEALRNGDGLVIIDARSAEAYAREHIPTAISFPHRSMTAETTAAIDQQLRRHRMQRVDQRRPETC